MRLVGVEHTTPAFAGPYSVQLSYKRPVCMVPRERFELSRPCEHYTLNVARLPFRHLGMRENYTASMGNGQRMKLPACEPPSII